MKYQRRGDEPESTDLCLADDIMVKSTRFAGAGMVIPQHVHAYDHVSVCAAGAARVEAGGVTIKHLRAGQSMVIEAGVAHRFITLLPETVILCVHNVRRAGGIELADPCAACTGCDLVEF